jgi:hypothetical protein
MCKSNRLQLVMAPHATASRVCVSEICSQIFRKDPTRGVIYTERQEPKRNAHNEHNAI